MPPVSPALDCMLTPPPNYTHTPPPSPPTRLHTLQHAKHLPNAWLDLASLLPRDKHYQTYSGEAMRCTVGLRCRAPEAHAAGAALMHLLYRCSLIFFLPYSLVDAGSLTTPPCSEDVYW